MLRFKSFDLMDDAGMNEFLGKYVKANGAAMLVSEGKVAIPYEDGEPMTPGQRAIFILEEKEKHKSQIDILMHSNRAIDRLIKLDELRLETAKADLAEATAVKKKDGYDKKKELEKFIESLEGNMKNLTAQKKMNTHEMERLQINCDLFDEEVKALRDSN